MLFRFISHLIGEVDVPGEACVLAAVLRLERVGAERGAAHENAEKLAQQADHHRVHHDFSKHRLEFKQIRNAVLDVVACAFLADLESKARKNKRKRLPSPTPLSSSSVMKRLACVKSATDNKLGNKQ